MVAQKTPWNIWDISITKCNSIFFYYYDSFYTKIVYFVFLYVYAFRYIHNLKTLFIFFSFAQFCYTSNSIFFKFYFKSTFIQKKQNYSKQRVERRNWDWIKMSILNIWCSRKTFLLFFFLYCVQHEIFVHTDTHI